MKRKAVESSALVSVGHDPDKKTLDVEFVGGRVYRYAKVPAAVYARLMAAESKGRFFSHHIRPVYRYVRVR